MLEADYTPQKEYVPFLQDALSVFDEDIPDGPYKEEAEKALEAELGTLEKDGEVLEILCIIGESPMDVPDSLREKAAKALPAAIRNAQKIGDIEGIVELLVHRITYQTVTMKGITSLTDKQLGPGSIITDDTAIVALEALAKEGRVGNVAMARYAPPLEESVVEFLPQAIDAAARKGWTRQIKELMEMKSLPEELSRRCAEALPLAEEMEKKLDPYGRWQELKRQSAPEAKSRRDPDEPFLGLGEKELLQAIDEAASAGGYIGIARLIKKESVPIKARLHAVDALADGGEVSLLCSRLTESLDGPLAQRIRDRLQDAVHTSVRKAMEALRKRKRPLTRDCPYPFKEEGFCEWPLEEREEHGWDWKP